MVKQKVNQIFPDVSGSGVISARQGWHHPKSKALKERKPNNYPCCELIRRLICKSKQNYI